MKRIEVTNLAIHSSEGVIINNLSLSVSENESLTILGETGSGKSLLALAILGNLPPMLTVSGSVKVDGKEMLEMPASEAASLWGTTLVMLPQEPWRALSPLMKIKHQIAEVFRYVKRATPATASEDTHQLLAKVGLEQHAPKVPAQLSGGMAQRTAIACSAATGADIVLADEPTKGLDTARKDDIIALLKARKAKGCLLTITHDVQVAKALGGKTLVMQRGVVVESGDAEKICSQPDSAYARALINAAPENWPHQEKQTNTFSPLISVKNLSLARGNQTLLEQVNFEIGAGEVVGLYGDSGSGKSSLADALLGLLPVSGEIRFHQPLARHEKLKLYQDPPAAFSEEATLRTLLHDIIKLHKLNPPPLDKLALELGLTPNLLDRTATEVSGGELQRIALLRAMLLKPKFLVADEPTSRLDPITAEKVTRLLIAKAREMHCALLFISHDVHQLNNVCDRVIAISDLSHKA
ncbi:ABC transporter ATP-binding protein [Alteromonas confluentis]|uniref:ABC transporter ATP-binding protein n=1 Tax=Alteromonas confluentis TaxID=1656094 RepID=A0A1E7Z9L5_9ALTE|nr:ATP-binding cassette domain-containing protein [Alteromonas confluentis]OFC70226.1 ABC transporter ATP-binding protein [Alteromonas confluentis]